MARPRTNIEPRILHAARAHFLESGVDGASLRTIARRARTNTGMIYYYFKTKDDLFLAVVEELYVKLLVELEAIVARDVPIQAKLEQFFLRLGAASQEELDVLRLVIREALVSTKRFERLFTRFQSGHLALMVRAFGEAMLAGAVDPNLPLPMLVASSFALGGVPQFLRRVAGDKPPFSALPEPNALAALSVDVLFRGIAPKKAAD